MELELNDENIDKMAEHIKEQKLTARRKKFLDGLVESGYVEEVVYVEVD